MEDILEKKETPERDIRQALIYFQQGYLKGGLTPGEVYAAMEEFEPVLRDLIQPHPGDFVIPDKLGLTPTQVAAIRKAHADYQRESVLHYRQKIWKGLKIIAGLIGRQNYNS